MEFNTLLTMSDFDLPDVAVMLHTPVQALEANWKMRLHTRTWGLNKN